MVQFRPITEKQHGFLESIRTNGNFKKEVGKIERTQVGFNVMGNVTICVLIDSDGVIYTGWSKVNTKDIRSDYTISIEEGRKSAYERAARDYFDIREKGKPSEYKLERLIKKKPPETVKETAKV